MLNNVKRFFSWRSNTEGKSGVASGLQVKSQLSPVESPTRLKKGYQAIPSYLRSAKPDKSNKLTLTDRNLATTDLSRTSRGVPTRDLLRTLTHASPDLSAARNAYLRTGITGSYTVVARNMDGTVNPEATRLANELANRFDVLPDYSNGFSGTLSIQSVSESLASELFTYGAMAGELVLGKDLLPQRIQPVSVTTIEFYPDADGYSPVQRIGDSEVNLNIPTFFYIALDQDLLEAYSSSLVESAIQPTLFSEQFLSDIRRVVRKAVHPRMKVSIDEESFRKNMPLEAQVSSEEQEKYYGSVISDIESKINNLEPEDALVYFDTLKIELENNGNISLSSEYRTLEDMANAKMSTGAKVMPAMLGHSSGTSNVASTETLIFMKSAEGAIRSKLNEFYSKVMTLAVRLFGLDVTVEFKYASIDLRPESELEAFKSMKQSRILELLSLGLMSDEEASIELTGHLPPTGYVPKAGTMFKSSKPSDINPYNGETNDGSAFNKSLKPDTPTGVKGENKKKNNLKE